MQESSFCGEDGQLYSQKIADFVDGELVGLYDMLVALAHHRVKIKADTEAEKDAKEFDLEGGRGISGVTPTQGPRFSGEPLLSTVRKFDPHAGEHADGEVIVAQIGACGFRGTRDPDLVVGPGLLEERHAPAQ